MVDYHTDNTGTPRYNQELSERRAGAVVDYLEGMGISPERLHPTGYGDRVPVAENDTGEGRAQNRRTEMKIIEKGR